MRSHRFLLPILLASTLSVTLHAQYAITTVAGGGPNNLPSLQSSIGTVSSVAEDSAGNVYIADSNSNRVLKVATTGNVTVVAGNGSFGYSGDGGLATAAALGVFGPAGIAVDAAGDIFIADTYNSVIREVSASSGIIQTVAGNGTAGYSGDGSAATAAELNEPYGVFVDASGNIFIADTENNVVREVTAGNIQTVAGNFAAGAGYSGNGAAATSAQLDQPHGVFVDALGNVFIADTLNSVVREVTAANGNIQTVAGSYYKYASTCNYSGDGGAATSAQLCLPFSVYVDASGNIVIADTLNSIIRAVNPSAAPVMIAGVSIPAGDIQIIAGSPGKFSYSGNGAAATAATLNFPNGVSLDASGNILIADTENYVIRQVASTGIIQTLAGNNTAAYSGDGSVATNAQLAFPSNLFVSTAGLIYIADTYNSAIRVFNPGGAPVTIGQIAINAGDIGTVAGNGVLCAVPIVPGACGDGGSPTSAQLNFPSAVAVDSFGNIYVAETGLPQSESSAIRVVNVGSSAITIAGTTVAAGTIQTVAGTLGTSGFAGDGGAPSSAQLSNPQGLFLDGSGNIYIADTDNSALRVVNTGSQALTIGGLTIQPNTIQTVAGTPPTACPDSSTGCGDNGLASAASLGFPIGVSLDSAGNIYIADSQNSAVRVVNPSTQAVTVAGTTINAGDITTVAGSLGRLGYSGDNGAPTSATLNVPTGVTVDSLGNIFIADSENSAIREVVAVDSTIETIAGTGSSGFSGDGGQATSALLDVPESISLGSAGIFVADSESSRVRQLTSTVTVAVVPPATTLAVGGTQQFLATVTGASNGNVTWQVNGITGGNSTVGTITSGGLYQAPAAAPASAISVTAVSDANGTTFSSASVTIAASGAGAISVSTNPSGVTVVYTSITQAFVATVSGETNTAVNWEVNAISGGNSVIGTIDSNGNYTPPSAVPSPALVTITAVSQADATVSGSYPVTIVTALATSTPTPQTVSPGGTANFSLALKANTGDPRHAITLSCLQSSLPSGASCTFTPTAITPSIDSSFGLAVTVPPAAAFLRNNPSGNNHKWLAASMLWSFGAVGIFLLAGTRRRGRRSLVASLMILPLLTLMACGGSNSSSTQNPISYNIQVQGTTSVQPNPVPIAVVKLTVQ
ncbi:exported hypothetical protein [Candidatus Sulfotelmatobacter kueseliae]|uniref:Teneurin NHL domain-containing protein n=1 Tax=Candidatus Sulfotelmatobacter kueseliae TaxID=2042962 RepID=A0A2U3KXJ8_9BACT|nr:exported hypothetical protein [Candidatus Sulfotelmatobacter kueseliae]